MPRTNEEIEELVYRVTSFAHALVIRTVGERVSHGAVYSLAESAARTALAQGGAEADALYAASMSFYNSVKVSCPTEGELAEDGGTLLLPQGTANVTQMATIIFEQMSVPPFVGAVLLALVEIAGGDFNAAMTATELMERAAKHAAVMGIQDFKVTTHTHGGH